MAISGGIIGGIEGGVNYNKFQVTITGTPKRVNYDTKPTGKSKNQYNTVDLKGIKISIKNNSGTEVYIGALEITILGVVYYTRRNINLRLQAGETYSSLLTDTKYSYGYSTEYEVSFSSGGAAAALLNIYYGDSSSSSTVAKGYNVADLLFTEPYLEQIFINQMPNKVWFYKNEEFNYDGLSVYAKWMFQEEQTLYRNVAIYNPTVSTPDMTTNGSKSIKISYNFKYAYYSINVYGILSVQASSSNVFNYRYGQALDIENLPNAIIQYEGGDILSITIDSTNIEWSNYNAYEKDGEIQQVYGKFTDEKTKEEVQIIAFIRIFTCSRIYISVEANQKTFYTNDNFNYAGMQITADYAELGKFVLLSNEYQISSPDMTSYGEKTITITYKESDSNIKTTSYKIQVIGLQSISLNLDNVKTYYIKNDIINLDNLIVTALLSDNSSFVCDNQDIVVDTSNFKYNQVGQYSIIVKYSYKGITKTNQYQVSVDSLTQITLSNYQSIFYILNGVIPQFSKGSLIVKGYFNYSVPRELNDTEYIVNVLEPLKEGEQSVSVSATIGDTKSSSYKINVINDYPISLGSKGIVVNKDLLVFQNGETFNKNGISVYCNMASGNQNSLVDFIVEGYENHVFSEEDPSGEIQANIFVDGIDESVGSVTIFHKVISSFMITQNPNKTKYKAGEVVSLNGIKGKITYNDNTIQYVTTITTNRTDPFTIDETGTYNLEVFYSNQNSTIALTIISVQRLNILNYSKEYIRHQSLDTSSWIIQKIFSDETIENIENNSNYISFDSTISELNALEPDEGKTYKTLNITYNNIDGNASKEIQIPVVALNSISLYDNEEIFVNRIVDYGLPFSLNGMVLKIEFNDETKNQQIVLSNETILENKIKIYGFDNNQSVYGKLPTCYLGYEFGGEEKNTSVFSIDCKYLEQIIVEKNESFINRQWYVDEKLDLTGITIFAKYIDTSNNTYPNIDITSDSTFRPANGSTLQNNGTTTINVSYSVGTGTTLQTKSTSFDIEVLEIILDDLTVNLDNLQKPLDSYVEGQRLNLAGIEIIALFNRAESNKTLELIDCDFYIGGLTESNKVSYTETMYVDKYNNQILYVSYSYNGTRVNKEVGTIQVKAKALESIAIYEGSTQKTNYLFGDVFSKQGLIISVTYNDGNPYKNITTGFTTDYDQKTEPFTKLDEGQRTVTISYSEGDITKTTSYQITVSAPSMTSLSFDTSLIQLNIRNGTEYSLDGLIVYGVFENNYKEKLESWQSDYSTILNIQEGKVSLSPNELGTKIITISAANPYNEEEIINGKLQVSVTPNATLTGIKLVFDDIIAYDEYYVGDKFTAKGMKVLATYQDISEATEVKGYTTNPSLDSVLRKGGRFTVVVSFTDTGNTFTASYDIIVSMPFDSGKTITKVYKIVFNVSELQVDEVTLNKDTLGFDLLPLYESAYVNVDTIIDSPTYGKNILTDLNKKDEAVGYVDLGSQEEITGFTTKNAHVIFFEDIQNPIEGGNNITVRFPHYVKENADKINKSTFGIMFGHSNSKNRLFISGNPDYANRDWYSGQLDSEFVSSPEFVNGNFGYFELGSERTYGETDNEIIGYDIIADDKMLVLKTKSDKETSVYFRKPTLMTAINSSGTSVTDIEDNSLYQEQFALSKGNSTVAGISPNSILNFNGDSLFISSDNQLVGLDLTGITGDNQRYATTRSYYIDEDLRNQDLSSSFLWSNNKYLFLVLNNKIYIAHHEFITNNQYEWFVIDVANVSSIIEINNQIYFGTKDGKFAKFVDNIYYDATKIYIKNNARIVEIDGSIHVQIPQEDINKLDENKKYKVAILDKKIELPNEITSMFYQVATIGGEKVSTLSVDNYDFYCDVENNILKLITTDLDRLNKLSKYLGDKNDFYLELLDESDDLPTITDNYNKKFTLKRIYNNDELIGDNYEVYDYLGRRVSVDTIYRARLCLKIEKNVDLTNIDKENSTFRLSIDGDILDIITYGNQQLDTLFQIEISEITPVEAYFINAPITMGNLESFKTIWSYTLTNDTNIPSELEVCYASNKIPYENLKTLAKISKDVLGFDLESFNFAKVDFDKNVVPRTYTNKRILSNVKFVCFAFRNYNDSNCVLSTMSITYTLPYPSYGSN